MIIYIHRHIRKIVGTGTIPIEQDSKLEMNVSLHNIYYRCVLVTNKFKTVYIFGKLIIIHLWVFIDTLKVCIWTKTCTHIACIVYLCLKDNINIVSFVVVVVVVVVVIATEIDWIWSLARYDGTYVGTYGHGTVILVKLKFNREFDWKSIQMTRRT